MVLFGVLSLYTPAELQSKVDTKLGELFNSQEVVFLTSVLV